MTFNQIVGTPLHVVITFTGLGDDDRRQPMQIDLSSNAGQALLEQLGLPPDLKATLDRVLTAPLDGELDRIWSGQRHTIAGLVKKAVESSTPGAYDILVLVPDKGTLHAEVTGLSPGMLDVVPLGTTGKQLNLSYRVPGINGVFSKATSGIFGKWADPSFSYRFDGEVMVYIAVPESAVDPLGVKVAFHTRNTEGAPIGIGAWLSVLGDALTALVNSTPFPPPTASDRMIDIDKQQLQGLASQIADLSRGFAAASNAGFRLVEPKIVNEGSGNQVTFQLTHPFDRPPAIVNPASRPMPSFFRPQIGTSVPVVNAGNRLDVIGTAFPAASANQLRIEWHDVESDVKPPEKDPGPPAGRVVKSQVQWGQYPGPPPRPASAPPSPTPPTDVAMLRNGRYDGRNTYSTPKNLTPSSWYGFRVRDFAPVDLIAGQWSGWAPFETAATDAVQIRLEYGSTSVVLDSAPLTSDGSFTIAVTIPAAVPPGTYPLWASLAGQDLAFAPIRVVGSGAQLPAVLQILHPDTGIPITGGARTVEGYAVTLQGLNFSAGNVELFIDSASGTLLGQATADAQGYFKIVLRWPSGVLGQHDVLAVGQQNSRASAPMFGQSLPR